MLLSRGNPKGRSEGRLTPSSVPSTTVHSPLSLRWHPLVGYIRNHVVRAVTPGAPSCAGIVSESFATAEDLLVPERFLGAGDDGTTLADWKPPR